MYNHMQLDPIDLLTGHTLTVSGGENPSATSTPVKVGLLSKLHIYVSNSGASTDTKVSVYGSPTLTSTRKASIASFELGANDEQGKYIEKEAIPSYVYAIATNSDATNEARVTITLERSR